MDIILSL
ncbi:hypothetical protein YPPY103_1522, partial [Yersinia pestis PY-103]